MEMQTTSQNFNEINQFNQQKKQFIKLLLEQQALKFGTFVLKSGRQSPYFFNLGSFNTGSSLAKLGHFYAELIQKLQLPADMLFGPAYKGIPLVSATCIALAKEHHIDLPYCFNRKLKKNYGDGGDWVGAPLQGQVIMVDDVITAGTTVRETLQMMEPYEAKLTAIVIAFDRQEKNQDNIQNQKTAVQEISEHYNIPIYSITSFNDVISYLKENSDYQQYLPSLLAYRERYGIDV